MPHTVHEDVKDVRSHTARIRSSLQELPRAVARHGWDLSRTEDDERYLRDLLQEIVGSTLHIADRIGIEL